MGCIVHGLQRVRGDGATFTVTAPRPAVSPGLRRDASCDARVRFTSHTQGEAAQTSSSSLHFEDSLPREAGGECGIRAWG